MLIEARADALMGSASSRSWASRGCYTLFWYQIYADDCAILQCDDVYQIIKGMGQGGANKNNAGVGVPDSWVSCPNRLQSAIEGMEMTHAVQMKALES